MNMRLTNRKMIETQIINRGISDKNVINAMIKIDRKNFVIEDNKDSCYEDRPLSIGYGQTISQPYIVGLMTEKLKVQPEDKVLEIGTGSGYQTAILCQLADFVYTIERIEELYKFAEHNLNKVGITNVKQILSDGTLGYEENAPYDKIIITAGAPSVPEPYFKQLKPGGRLIMPVGQRYSQSLDIYTVDNKHNPELIEKDPGCVFVPLKGKYGW
jgi:protein-L-isoaspartate(D-aspartate) O-methyltransferase